MAIRDTPRNDPQEWTIKSDREGFFIVDEFDCEAQPSVRYSSFEHARSALTNIIQEELAMSDTDQDPPAEPPHVATPAPGENSERATIAQQLRDAVTASGGVDASAELILTAAVAIEVMARDWLADRKDCFAAGRRSMREEAAKWHDAKIAALDEQIEANNSIAKQRSGTIAACITANDECRREQTSHRLAASAIRAIPEKQS